MFHPVTRGFSRKAVRIAAVAASAALAFTLGACSAGPASNPLTTDATPSESPTPVYVTAPLTGLQYLEGSNPFLNGPVVMGKIDNSAGARPQAGLNQADVVFDEMVEGGMTRFLAVWHSQLPADAGPIRSVRPMDPDIATQFGGIIAYSGGQRPFVLAMQASGIYNATETTEQLKKGVHRVTDRVAPHNLFLAAQQLQSEHPELAAPKPLFSFLNDSNDAGPVAASLQGKSVTQVKSQFPSAMATWDWSAKSGVWLRTQDGLKHLDAIDGKQIRATNVVVLRVAIDRSYKDPRYGFVPKTVLEGTGTGTIFGGGRALDIKWSKAGLKAPLVLTDLAGSPVSFLPGNTWFELVPTDVGKVTIKYLETATPTPSATAKK